MVVKPIQISKTEPVSPIVMATQCWNLCKSTWTFGKNTYHKVKTTWTKSKESVNDLAEWIWILFLTLVTSEQFDEHVEESSKKTIQDLQEEEQAESFEQLSVSLEFEPEVIADVNENKLEEIEAETTNEPIVSLDEVTIVNEIPQAIKKSSGPNPFTIVEEDEEDEFADEEKEKEWRTANGGLARFAGLENLAAMRSTSLDDDDYGNESRNELMAILDESELGEPVDNNCEVLWQSLVAKYASDASSSLAAIEPNIEGNLQDYVLDSTDLMEPTCDRNDDNEDLEILHSPKKSTFELNVHSPKFTNEEFSAALGKRLKEYLASEASDSTRGEMSADDDVDLRTTDDVKDISDEIASPTQHSDFPSESYKLTLEAVDEIPKLRILNDPEENSSELISEQKDIPDEILINGSAYKEQSDSEMDENIMDDMDIEDFKSQRLKMKAKEQLNREKYVNTLNAATGNIELQSKQSTINTFIKRESTESKSSNAEEEEVAVVADFSFKLRPKDKDQISFRLKEEINESLMPSNISINDATKSLPQLVQAPKPNVTEIQARLLETEFPYVVLDNAEYLQFAPLNDLDDDGTSVDFAVMEDVIEPAPITDKFNVERCLPDILHKPAELTTILCVEMAICDEFVGPDFETAENNLFELPSFEKIDNHSMEPQLEYVHSVDKRDSILIMADSREIEETRFETAVSEEYALPSVESVEQVSTIPAMTTATTDDRRNSILNMAKCSMDHEPQFETVQNEAPTSPSGETIKIVLKVPLMKMAVSTDQRDSILIMANSSEYYEPMFETVKSVNFTVLSEETICTKTEEPFMENAVINNLQNSIMKMAVIEESTNLNFEQIDIKIYKSPSTAQAEKKKWQELPLVTATVKNYQTLILTMAKNEVNDEPSLINAVETDFKSHVTATAELNEVASLYSAHFIDNRCNIQRRAFNEKLPRSTLEQTEKIEGYARPKLEKATQQLYKATEFEIVKCNDGPVIEFREYKPIEKLTQEIFSDDSGIDTKSKPLSLYEDSNILDVGISTAVESNFSGTRNLFSDTIVDETYNTILDKEASMEADESSGSINKGILDTTVYELDSNFDSKEFGEANTTEIRDAIVKQLDKNDLGETTSIDEMLVEHLNSRKTHIPDHLSEIQDLLSRQSDRNQQKKSWGLSDEDLPSVVDDDQMDLDEFRALSPGLTAEEEAELAELAEIDKNKTEAEYKQFLTMPAGLTQQELDELAALEHEKENAQAVREAERKELEKFLNMPTGLSEQEQQELAELLEEESQDQDISRATEERLAAFLSAARMESGYSEDEFDEPLDNYMNLPSGLTEEEEMMLREGTDGELDIIKDEEYRAKIRQRYLDELDEDEDRVLLDEYEFAEQYGSDFEYDDEYDYEREEDLNTVDDKLIGAVAQSNTEKNPPNIKLGDEPVAPPRKIKKEPELASSSSQSHGIKCTVVQQTNTEEENVKAKDVKNKKFFRLGPLGIKRKKKMDSFVVNGNNIRTNYKAVRKKCVKDYSKFEIDEQTRKIDHLNTFGLIFYDDIDGSTSPLSTLHQDFNHKRNSGINKMKVKPGCLSQIKEVNIFLKEQLQQATAKLDNISPSTRISNLLDLNIPDVISSKPHEKLNPQENYLFVNLESKDMDPIICCSESDTFDNSPNAVKSETFLKTFNKINNLTGMTTDVPVMISCCARKINYSANKFCCKKIRRKFRVQDLVKNFMEVCEKSLGGDFVCSDSSVNYNCNTANFVPKRMKTFKEVKNYQWQEKHNSGEIREGNFINCISNDRLHESPQDVKLIHPQVALHECHNRNGLEKDRGEFVYYIGLGFIQIIVNYARQE